MFGKSFQHKTFVALVVHNADYNKAQICLNFEVKEEDYEELKELIEEEGTSFLTKYYDVEENELDTLLDNLTKDYKDIIEDRIISIPTESPTPVSGVHMPAVKEDDLNKDIDPRLVKRRLLNQINLGLSQPISPETALLYAKALSELNFKFENEKESAVLSILNED